MAPSVPSVSVIGVVRSPRLRVEHTPVQGALNLEEEAVFELDPAYSDGLDGLDGFDFAWLLTWLGDSRSTAGSIALRQVLFLLRRSSRRIGVFATRGPRRINPIGLTLVRILEVDPPIVRFAGVDVVDGTPVLDIKPYVAAFDTPSGAVRCGWFDQTPLSNGATPTDLAQ